MDQWKKKSLREEQFQQGTKSPSFSSTLLDAIYRSIDEGGGGGGEDQKVFHRETMKKKQSTTSNVRGGGGVKYSVVREEIKEMDNRERRASMMLDKWMIIDKKETEKISLRRKSLPDFDRKVLMNNDRSSMFIHSTSSSSDSSSGGGFSSSEAESVYGSRSRSSSVPTQRPKPVRTSVSVRPERNLNHETHHHHHQHEHDQRKSNNSVSDQKSKHESSFIRTKSRALKIYGDLKKAKQPISPGGKLASFINSLFHAKRGKSSSSSSVEDCTNTRSEKKSKSTQTSTCSSASSLSRSCLSKAPSTKSSNGTKRSVRFYPVSVIVDEDSRPCGQKSLYEDKPSLLMSSSSSSMNEEVKLSKNLRVQEAARELIESYRKRSDFNMRDLHQHEDEDEDVDDIDGDLEDDEDEDDAASYASSDLFELDNLKAIGIDSRYREELPVYETTHLQTNRAIANGFIIM